MAQPPVTMCRRMSTGFLAAILVVIRCGFAQADTTVGVERRGASADGRSDVHETARMFVARTCGTIETEAKRSGLPPGFFARLIWQESRFDPNAISPKGARGIAQFMPGTARERGLADPFDAKTALAASAAFLEDLKNQFGNLGLASAAYNAGPDRVARWRNGTSRLPRETRGFVRAITGLTAEEWASPDVDVPDFALHETLPFVKACQKFASLVRRSPGRESGGGLAEKPWGALIASHFTRKGAEAALKRLAGAHSVVAEHQPIEFLRRRNPSRGGKAMVRVMLGADDRKTAGALCRRMNRDGGACIVVKN